MLLEKGCLVSLGNSDFAIGHGVKGRVIPEALTMLLALSLTGCSFAPDYVQPSLPVPDSYAVATPAGASLAGRDWEQVFPDPELRRLVAQALANNRDIRIAAARVAQARGAWRIEGASLYPQLDAVATGTRGQAFYSLPVIGDQIVDVKSITAQLSASWEIDFWGRLRNLKEAAREQFLASEESRRAVATDLIAQVALGYLLERDYEERAALTQQSITTRKRCASCAAAMRWGLGRSWTWPSPRCCWRRRTPPCMC